MYLQMHREVDSPSVHDDEMKTIEQKIREEAIDDAIEIIRSHWQRMICFVDPMIRQPERVVKEHLEIIVADLKKRRST